MFIAGKQASNKGISGNFAGDGMQLGGTFVLEKDGTVLFAHRQAHFSDHPKPDDVLAAALVSDKDVQDNKAAVLAAQAAAEDFEAKFQAAGQQPADSSNAADKAKQFVEQSIRDNKVIIFSKSYCPYCAKAKKALTNVGAQFQAVELDQRDDGAAIQDALKALTGRSTVPNVFVAGKSIGGGDDTERLERSGELQQMISAL